jgi:hypothetical protein
MMEFEGGQNPAYDQGVECRMGDARTRLGLELGRMRPTLPSRCGARLFLSPAMTTGERLPLGVNHARKQRPTEADGVNLSDQILPALFTPAPFSQ